MAYGCMIRASVFLTALTVVSTIDLLVLIHDISSLVSWRGRGIDFPDDWVCGEIALRIRL